MHSSHLYRQYYMHLSVFGNNPLTIKVCHLFNTKLLPGSLISVNWANKFVSIHENLHSMKCIWKCLLEVLITSEVISRLQKAMYKREFWRSYAVWYRYTVRNRYNKVNFYPNLHIRHPIARLLVRDIGFFCGFKYTFIFCHSHRSDVYNTILYWIAL